MGFQKYFTISIDDGVQQDKQIIPLLKQYGLQCTFNLNAGLLGHSAKIANISRIPKDEIRQVYDGFEVASHGLRHENFLFLSKEKTELSLKTDIAELTQIVGYPIKGHAYPFGIHTQKVETFLRENGILYGRRIGNNPSFQFPQNPYQYVTTCWFNHKKVMRLLENFIHAEPTQDDMLFMMWGHGYELDYGLHKCTIEHLHRMFSLIAGRNDIVYCNASEAFAAHAAR